ncbi:MAG TPA: hypothetical protein VIP05_15980 [Burkholderiaceae bacterium]
MNRSPDRKRLAALLLLGLAAADANAYIDPNTGGLLYQILLPVIVAVTAGWRYLKLSVVQLFRTLLRRGHEHPGGAPEDHRDNDHPAR